MIQIESVTIKELRGIRDLTLTLDRASFVISGPNGSGKSGVVDAIQFALTGEMSRLKGAGTADITLAAHGPHVEKRNDPGSASVTVTAFIPHLNTTASITRTIKKPKAPHIVPKDAAVIAVFDELAQHGEVTLSRREIIKFILTEASKRSRDVQTLLKLDSIDELRATLKTTENKLWTEQTTAKAKADAAEESLKRHLDIPALKTDDLLAAVNIRRRLLGLAPLAALEKDTILSDGLAEGADASDRGQGKDSALGELGAAISAVTLGLETPVALVVSSLLDDLSTLENDPTMLELVRRQPFLQDGLDLIDGPQCPLCDTSWDVDALRGHLRGKLAKSVGAQQTRDRILKAGLALVAAVTQLRAQFLFVTKLPETDADFSGQLQQWSAQLLAFAEGLKSFDGIVLSTEQLRHGWSMPPSGLLANLEAIQSRVRARPDKSATAEARSFITVAQDRLNSYRIARREHEERKADAARGRLLYKTYCDVAEAELAKLYAEVEQEFGAFYRLLNEGDEAAFKAELTPAEGTLGLLVDFHEKGMYPPGAYHSEGHQDGMGVCLYLALMRRVLGSKFTFAVLDDVVMSVDRDHRKQFCKLLKTTFPDVQFIITTHDQVWARQIRSEGLVGSKAAVAFHHWTVETGPVLDEIAEVWDQIDADLAKNDVPNAAARLRRHMEYVAADLAHELGAKVRFKADGGYDMGELLSAVIGRQKELLKDAAKAAQSWDDDDQRKVVELLQAERASILAEKGGEEWVINKALHYNEWADFSKNDFTPVVSVFKRLIEQFRCPRPKCDSWLSLTPRVDPIDLRCACGATRINLKAKSA